MTRMVAFLLLILQNASLEAHLKATPEECEKLYGKVQFTREVKGGVVMGYQPKLSGLEGVVVMAEFREGAVTSIHYEIQGKDQFTPEQFALITSLNALAMKSQFVEVGPTPKGTQRLWVTKDYAAHMLVGIQEASIDLITRAAAIDIIKEMPDGKSRLSGPDNEPSVAKPETPTRYVEIRLPLRMTVEIPQNWHIRDHEQKVLVSPSGDRILDLTSTRTHSGTETTLFSSRSTPQTTYASAFVFCRVPAVATAAQLLKTDKQTLKETAREMHAQMAEQLSATPDKLVGPSRCAVEMIGDSPALLFQYQRSGPKGDVLVFDYQIARPEATFELMISYRASEAEFWESEVKHILESVRFGSAK